MKRMLAATLLLLAATNITAQSQSTSQSNEPKCTAQTVRSLTIRGLRLGMTTDEVLALFPGSSEREDIKSVLANAAKRPYYGLASFGFESRNYPNQERLAGVSYIGVTLFDGRLVGFSMRYQNFDGGGASWNNDDEFITKLSEAFGLPTPKYWEKNGSSKVLDCEGLKISAWASGGPGSFEVIDRSFSGKIKDRALAEEEKRRHDFKP